MYLFEISIIFIIRWMVIWSYLKCWLIICCLDYLWLFEATADYLAALHGAKINTCVLIRVTKTPWMKSRIEPKNFRSQTAYVTTTLHWYSNSCHLNMVYNQVSLSGTIIKKHSYCICVLPRHCHSVCCYCRQSCFLLLLMLLMLFDFMFSV